MAQENFFDDESISNFGIETSTEIDAKEFEAYMEGSTSPTSSKITPSDIKPATEKDKQDAAEKGKAKSDDEIAQEIRAAKKKEEEDARKFIEGDEENEDDSNKTNDQLLSKSKKSNTSQNNDPNDISNNDFESLAKDLYKVGIFTPDADNEEEEELPTTAEEFADRFNWEKQKVAEQMVYNFAGRHGEEYREMFNAIFVNGADPREYVNQFLEVRNFKDMDLSDESNQQAVVESSLRNQGWEDEDIKDEVKRLKLNADLESAALRHHKALVKSEEAELTRIQEESKARLERKKQLEAQYSSNLRTILSEKLKTQDFDGIPVNRESANKTIDFLETKKWKLPTGELITDFDRLIMDLQHPQNHEVKIKLGLLLQNGYEPGKPITLNLVSVAKKAVSKESNELFNFVKSKKVKTGNNITETKSKSDFLDGL